MSTSNTSEITLSQFLRPKSRNLRVRAMKTRAASDISSNSLQVKANETATQGMMTRINPGNLSRNIENGH